MNTHGPVGAAWVLLAHLDTADNWKRCTKCDEILPVQAFASIGGGRTELRGDCRRCRREYLRGMEAKRRARKGKVKR